MSDYDGCSHTDVAEYLDPIRRRLVMAGQLSAGEDAVMIQAWKRLYHIKETKWIRVNKRLPELSGLYLVAMEQYTFGGRHVCIATWNHITQCWSIKDRRMEGYDVEYWTSIPTAPDPKIDTTSVSVNGSR